MRNALPQEVRQFGEDADLSDVVGVHNLHCMRAIPFGPILITENPESQYGNTDRAVVAIDLGKRVGVVGSVIGVEFDGVHGLRSCCVNTPRFVGKLVCSSGREDNDPVVGEASGDLYSYLASPAENEERARGEGFMPR